MVILIRFFTFFFIGFIVFTSCKSERFYSQKYRTSFPIPSGVENKFFALEVESKVDYRSPNPRKTIDERSSAIKGPTNAFQKVGEKGQHANDQEKLLKLSGVDLLPSSKFSTKKGGFLRKKSSRKEKKKIDEEGYFGGSSLRNNVALMALVVGAILLYIAWNIQLPTVTI